MVFVKSRRRSRRRFVSRRRMGGPLVMRRRRRPMTAGNVKRIIDAELKFRDLSVGPVEIPAVNGSVVQISNIAQGDGVSQRTGNWIKPTSFMGAFTLEGNPASAQTTTQFRIGVVQWKENESINAIDLTKLMQDNFAPHLGFNIQNKGQFKILWSRIGILSNNNDNPQFQKLFRFYVKPSLKVLYDDAAFRNNQLFVFGFSDLDTLSEPPTYLFDVRLRYTDS